MLKRFWVTLLLVPGMLLLTSPDAKTQVFSGSGPGPTNSQIAGAIAGVAAAGAAVAIIVVHEHSVHTLTGCVASNADGLLVTKVGDKQVYALTGDTAGIKAGDRVKLSGKRKKVDASHRQFVVSKLAKDYGACKS